MSKSLLIIALCFLCFCAKAQPPCGFDVMQKKLLLADPSYAARIKIDEVKIQQFISNKASLKASGSNNKVAVAITYVPVVVHVMHTGGAVGSTYNPSDADINGAIDYLNQVYAGTYPGMMAPFGKSAIVNMNLQFVLAQRTPSCGYANGIDRIDASSIPNYTNYGVNNSSSNGCTDLQLKNFARWDPSSYYNIWVVNKIDGADGTSGQFIAGYAYFAGASTSLDGTVMLATQMRTGQKTLPHEIGHAFNLYHPFEGSTSSTVCPANANCTSDGDMICDTDPITDNVNAGSYNFTCRTGTNTCVNTPYTINTENNFMSYTTCYDLFTNDQQARVTAAFSLPSRASLANSNGGTPCANVINFATGSDAVSEANSTTVTALDCRLYKDYTYTMTIGAPPTGAVSATISLGGSATAGLDYDVTTNGSFSSPANQLTFASGITTPQPFTVRVYNDANVESGENIVLSFTLSNSNATVGTTFPTLTISIADNDTNPIAASTVTQQITSSTKSSISGAPFNSTITTQKSQYIYNAGELKAGNFAAGNITGFQLNVTNKVTSSSFSNFTIKMANTTTNYLVDGSSNPVTGMTVVATNANFSTVSGWNSFTLTTPFAWDGTSNLAVEICYDGISGNTGADVIDCYLDGGNSNQGNTAFNNNQNCSNAFSVNNYYSYGLKPVIKLTVDITATPIETVALATKTEYIGKGSADYFYSNNNALLLKLANVNANLGCTQASITQAGNTWQSFYTGQRSAKVFKVTPTTNGTTTAYDNSLYFTNAELGGNIASTLKIAKTTATDIADANGSNTILYSPVITNLGSTTIFTGSFTGFSQFFLVNSFVVLPLNLLDFSGKLTTDNKTQLKWVTSQEQNNKNFQIEMSRNGLDFLPLGEVPSKGNSAITQNYFYLHVKPQSGITYYRLKQIDLNGHFTYSKIILIDISNNGTANISLYPVPAHNLITINFGNITSKEEITVYSTDMKAVLKQTINSIAVKTDINISSLPKGIYFIKVAGGATSELLKFIKD